MFDNRELEAMAKEAKNKLMGQKKEEDIYADFRDEEVTEETQEERPQIKRRTSAEEESEREKILMDPDRKSVV